MKQPTRIQVIISLSVLCCFIAGLFHSTYPAQGIVGDNDKTQHPTTDLLLAQVTLFSPVSFDKGLTNDPNAQSYSFYKNHLKGFLACCKTREQGLGNLFRTRVAIASRIVPKLSATTIIYPFHYFW